MRLTTHKKIFGYYNRLWWFHRWTNCYNTVTADGWWESGFCLFGLCVFWTVHRCKCRKQAWCSCERGRLKVMAMQEALKRG